MSESEQVPEADDPREALAAEIAAAASWLEVEGGERVTAARKLRALATPKVFDDLDRLGKAIAKLEGSMLPERAEALGVSPVLARVAEYVRGAEARVRSRLGQELRDACEAAGLAFRIVSREEPVEVRIPPFLVRLDFRRGRADLLFAREVVAGARPGADAILAAREKALKELQSGFAPERFFDDCLSAYRAALAVAGRETGDRVELLDLLPYLAVARQTRKFRASPAKETFRSYPKARFAYDVFQLRRFGGLVRSGLRLNFGVATGTTASQKDRVVYLEDENGEGEYKLTVFFTPAGEP